MDAFSFVDIAAVHEEKKAKSTKTTAIVLIFHSRHINTIHEGKKSRKSNCERDIMKTWIKLEQ